MYTVYNLDIVPLVHLLCRAILTAKDRGLTKVFLKALVKKLEVCPWCLSNAQGAQDVWPSRRETVKARGLSKVSLAALRRD